MSVKILKGDCRDILQTLPDQSVHCCVTSPPYFGLRDYGTGRWQGGDADCDHRSPTMRDGRNEDRAQLAGSAATNSAQLLLAHRSACGKCGAVKVDSQIGLEATPDAFVAEMVAVFREVRRVLRDDGTLWLNLGSSYISDYIESHEYVIRPDITPQERDKALRAVAAAITAALPEVRESDASAKSEMPGMLSIGEPATAELHQTTLPEVQQPIHRPQGSCGEGAGEILQPILREVGKPNAQESDANCRMPNVREEVRQIQSGDEKDQGNEALLLSGMLVQPQCEGQSLSLDGRSGWTDESGRHEMAQVRASAGQMALSNMPCDEEIGGPSHSPVRDSQGTPLGSEQRFDAVPQVSRRIPSSRTRARRNPVFHSVGASDGLEKISIPKTAIPADVLHLFQPRHILKPKDDAMIPEQVALALRDDGWIMRQTICWSKPNPMPESVTDRCTKAHEYIFLMSKKARYHYDAGAIAEAVAASTVERLSQPNLDNQIGSERVPGKTNGNMKAVGRATGDVYTAKAFGTPQSEPRGPKKNFGEFATRNKRSVWEVTTQPFSEAHFATFPPDLIEPCIKAGCPIGGAVLDPFGGAGTTALVADRLGRDAILIELNESYAHMAADRIRGDAGLFAQINEDSAA